MEKIPLKLKNWAKTPFLNQLHQQFAQADIFLVGGAVRDLLLNRPTQDFDLVVRNVSKPQLEKFLKTQGKVNLVGKKFGVFKFVPKGWSGTEIDIALPRTEHAINFSGAYKDFKINSNAKLKIEADLGRRDFTINAIAFNLNQQKLVDPYNGLSDLKKKNIRAAGDAAKRFREDYSRMLRAIRFACQLDFTIEQKTWSAVTKQIKNLTKKIGDKPTVPYEVIAKELVKALNANPLQAIKLLDESGALEIVMPELLKMKGCPQPLNWHSEGDCWTHTMLALKNLESKKFKMEFKNQPISPELIWGLLFHDLGKPYTVKRTDRLRFNNHDNISAQKFRVVAERLKLAATGLNLDTVEKIIAKHMLPAHAKSSNMKDTTIEKYFFNDNFPGQELLMLIFADISASIPEQKGQPDYTQYQLIKKRINNLKKGSKNQTRLPKPVINGHDIMKQFKLPSGQKIGELLTIAREAQLKGKIKNKREGLAYIKKMV